MMISCNFGSDWLVLQESDLSSLPQMELNDVWYLFIFTTINHTVPDFGYSNGLLVKIEGVSSMIWLYE